MTEIREAGIQDAGVIANLHAQSWRNTYRGMLRDDYLDGDIVVDRLAIWEERLRNPSTDQLALVAFDNGHPVGFAFVLGNADPKWGAMLDNLHVLPTAQGKGVGKQLIHLACAWMHGRFPNQGLFLWVFEDNIPARHFYEKLGADAIERAVIEPPGGGSVAEWRYAWRDMGELRRATRQA